MHIKKHQPSLPLWQSTFGTMMIVTSCLLIMVCPDISSARPTRSPLAMGPVPIPRWEQQQMVDVINQARATTVLPAANMKVMEWDDSLAALAQDFTNQCACSWKQYKNAFLSWCDEMPDPVSVVKVSCNDVNGDK
jgi:hypothetical protein